MARRMWVGILLGLLLGCLPWTASAAGSYNSAGGGGVYDRGPTAHAQGSVYGGVYVVVRGDTLHSVSRRFGLTVSQMAAANGICNPWWIFPGQRLVIPGMGVPPRPQPPPPSLPSGPPYITIIEPVPHSTLPPVFTVRGMGGALAGGQVLVRARDAAGLLLVEGIATLTGPDVLTGGEGSWSLDLWVRVPTDTAGTLEAGTPSGAGVTVQPVVVPVRFTGSGPNYVVYGLGQCQITLTPAAPLYAFPGGPFVTQADVVGPFDAIRGARWNDRTWYEFVPLPAEPAVWVTDVATLTAGCAW